MRLSNDERRVIAWKPGSGSHQQSFVRGSTQSLPLSRAFDPRIPPEKEKKYPEPISGQRFDGIPGETRIEGAFFRCFIASVPRRNCLSVRRFAGQEFDALSLPHVSCRPNAPGDAFLADIPHTLVMMKQHNMFFFLVFHSYLITSAKISSSQVT